MSKIDCEYDLGSITALLLLIAVAILITAMNGN